MKTAITVAIDKDGKSKVLHGPEVAFEVQRKAFTANKLGDLPKGAVRVELYERTRHTVGVDRELQKRREDQEKEQAAEIERRAKLTPEQRDEEDRLKAIEDQKRAEAAAKHAEKVRAEETAARAKAAAAPAAAPAKPEPPHAHAPAHPHPHK